MCEQPESSHFSNPFDFRSLGLIDYPYVIKTPMDLSTISSRLNQNFYQHFDDFLSDIILIWNNCRIYNLPDSAIVQQVEIMENNMLRFCNINEISLKNSMNRLNIEENPDIIPFKDKLDLSEILKKLSQKKLGILIDVIEIECPQAVTKLKDQTLQIRIDALDKTIFSRIKEMALMKDEETI